MEYAPQDVPQEATQNAGRDATDSGLSIRELEAQITELAGHLNAANHRWLVLIAEFDRRNGWSDGATQSCAHWLSWKCGLDLGAAREKVRVARAIGSLPKISVAMSNRTCENSGRCPCHAPPGGPTFVRRDRTTCLPSGENVNWSFF